MSAAPAPILYCHCAYAKIVPAATKQEVLERLVRSGVPFEAVPDLCEMSARKDPRARNRYNQSERKHDRTQSLVDVHIQREIDEKQRKLYQQMVRNSSIHDRAPHMNGEIIVNPKSSIDIDQEQLAKRSM